MIDGLFEEIKRNVLDLYETYKDSEEISERVKDNALSFIKLLSIKGLETLEDIYPNPNGTISFDFGIGELEIGNVVMSYFVSKSPIIYGDNIEINEENIKKFETHIIK